MRHDTLDIMAVLCRMLFMETLKLMVNVVLIVTKYSVTRGTKNNAWYHLRLLPPSVEIVLKA